MSETGLDCGWAQGDVWHIPRIMNDKLIVPSHIAFVNTHTPTQTTLSERGLALLAYFLEMPRECLDVSRARDGLELASVEAVMKAPPRRVLDALGVAPGLGGCARAAERHPRGQRHTFGEAHEEWFRISDAKLQTCPALSCIFWV